VLKTWLDFLLGLYAVSVWPGALLIVVFLMRHEIRALLMMLIHKIETLRSFKVLGSGATFVPNLDAVIVEEKVVDVQPLLKNDRFSNEG
jgi:hypothetical protein